MAGNYERPVTCPLRRGVGARFMSEFLLYYKRPDPTTWVYMSSFLTLGLYFVFRRFWSVRNLDIVLLILLAPGLLMVHEGRRRELRELESEKIASQPSVRQPGTGQPSSDQSNTEPQNGRPDMGSMPTVHVMQRRADAEQQSLLDRTGEALSAVVLVSTVSEADAQSPDQDSPESSETSSEVPPGNTTQTQASSNPADEDPNIEDTGASESTPEKPDEPKVQEMEDRSSGAPKPVETVRPKVAPTIQDETHMPLIVEPDALDKNQEADALQGDLDASDSSYSARQLQRTGFIFLFIVEMLILVRLMIDPMMVRRPLLDPNLTTGGLYFISISLFVFMMGNVVTSTPRTRIWQGPELGPGYALMHRLPSISTRPVSNAVGGETPATADELLLQQQGWTLLAKIVAILAHLAIVTGIVLIGSRHFDNIRAGVGCATLYLVLPYTAQMTGRVDHALPAALLLWATLNYRKPVYAGIFLGLAAGLVYYPLFLLPLWCSYYWRKGVRRFTIGVVSTLAVLMVLLTVGGTDSLLDHLLKMFGLFRPTMEPRGIWQLGWDPVYRLPVIVAFGILSFFFASWPSPKNLGTLISGSAALMVAAQFWHGYGGGLYIAWFLPLLLLTIFRPNLQDRVATKVVFGNKRRILSPEAKAA